MVFALLVVSALTCAAGALKETAEKAAATTEINSTFLISLKTNGSKYLNRNSYLPYLI
ncbi:hypothetical protein FD39_GL001471 [Lactobacillus amylolyticus DSM 11664]|uniref:hypothetical protein n=1 Tax=Lactobacillus amylolyticus TaxID=83683 RepID=UPI0006F036E4|nr:hypothetical protein [Lactobacillus amylolyticus]KRL19022.1 hypothetical protein FD39_GL001471 [Lactobacillus amylolyticus DSM 11664]